MRPDTIMQVFTQSKVLLNDRCSRAKINTPQYNISNLVDISVSLMVCMKNDNQCFSRQSPEGVCIINALKVLYYQQNLRMHPTSRGDRNCPALTWIESEVQRHCPVNHDESSRSLLLYFPIHSGGVLYQVCLHSVRYLVDNTYRSPYSRRLSMQSELRLD